MPQEAVASSVKFDVASPPPDGFALGCHDRIPTFQSLINIKIFQNEVVNAERNGMHSVRIAFVGHPIPTMVSIAKERLKRFLTR